MLVLQRVIAYFIKYYSYSIVNRLLFIFFFFCRWILQQIQTILKVTQKETKMRVGLDLLITVKGREKAMSLMMVIVLTLVSQRRSCKQGLGFGITSREKMVMMTNANVITTRGSLDVQQNQGLQTWRNIWIAASITRHGSIHPLSFTKVQNSFSSIILSFNDSIIIESERPSPLSNHTMNRFQKL